jgi:hypothetical protein
VDKHRRIYTGIIFVLALALLLAMNMLASALQRSSVLPYQKRPTQSLLPPSLYVIRKRVYEINTLKKHLGIEGIDSIISGAVPCPRSVVRYVYILIPTRVYQDKPSKLFGGSLSSFCTFALVTLRSSDAATDIETVLSETE